MMSTKGYHYSFWGEHSAMETHKCSIYYILFCMCLQENLVCVGAGDAICDAKKKNHWFYMFNKNLCGNYIFIKFSFMTEHSILPSTRCFSHISQRYPATESKNKNLSSKTTCLNFQYYISLLFCVTN